MRKTLWPRLAASALLLWSSGCTALHDIPRGEYGARTERRHVRVETADKLVYEFDSVEVQGDTLIGYRRRDVEGPFDEFAEVRLALVDVTRLAARGVDWYRTGLVGGGVVAAVVAAGMSVAAAKDGSGSDSGGGKVFTP